MRTSTKVPTVLSTEVELLKTDLEHLKNRLERSELLRSASLNMREIAFSSPRQGGGAGGINDDAISSKSEEDHTQLDHNLVDLWRALDRTLSDNELLKNRTDQLSLR